jgi:hypothetical protein
MYVVFYKEQPGTGSTSIRGLNLAVVMPTTIQLTTCSFSVVKKVKAYPAAQAYINRKPLYILYKCYIVQCGDKGCTEFVATCATTA